MLCACERFPQLGGIREFMALPQGERVLYEQYVRYVIEEEEKRPYLKVGK